MTMLHQPNFWMKSFLSHLGRLRRDENGATAVVIAIMSPVLIGGMALGGETGYWYYTPA